MPFLAELGRKGLAAPLASVYPAKTIPAWHCLATGLDPGTLGIYGFAEPKEAPGRSRLVQTFRPTEAVWDRLSRKGYRVGVLNFPVRAGYPINGFLVPGMFGDHPPTHPRDLGARLEAALGEPRVGELPPYREVDRADWIARATRGVTQRAAEVEFLQGTFRTDFLFVLVRETDRVEHQHWGECALGPGRMGRDLLEFWRAVDRACARIDRAFRSTGGPAVTLIISDHGHGAAGGEFFTNRWLQSEGFLTLRPGAEPLRRRFVSRVLLASDRFPPTRWLVRSVVDRFRRTSDGPPTGAWLTGDASFEAMAGRIDWERTEAFSYPVPEAVYVNPYRRDLSPERRREIVARLRERLSGLREAHVEAWPPSELYREVRGSPAPDLLLRVNGMADDLRMDFSYPDPFLPRRPEFFYGSGVHRMDGILIASGNGGDRPPSSPPSLSLLDIAPTVLDGMGLQSGSAMAGRSFAPWLGLSGT